jgi:hypothetical protein
MGRVMAALAPGVDHLQHKSSNCMCRNQRRGKHAALDAGKKKKTHFLLGPRSRTHHFEKACTSFASSTFPPKF